MESVLATAPADRLPHIMAIWPWEFEDPATWPGATEMRAAALAECLDDLATQG